MDALPPPSLLEATHGGWAGWFAQVATRTSDAIGGLRPFLQVSPRDVHRLVFVCLGNLNRSAFAEGVARRSGVAGAAVMSVGIGATPGDAPPPTTLAVAAEFGVDLSAHRATRLVDHEVLSGDLLVVMEARHARLLVEQGVPPEAIGLLGHWATPRRLHLQDPHRLSAAYCRSCFESIRSATQGLIDELAAGGSPAVTLPR